jgi:hypothetical protein
MALDNLTPKKEWPYPWQTPFLDWLTKRGNVADACRKAKVSRKWAYEVRNADLDFAAAWEEALTEGVELLEGEAYRRAKDGTLKPIYHAGVRVGTVREYSDTLTIFLLKAHKPEKYRENVRVEHTGKDGNEIVIRVEYAKPRTNGDAA